MYKYTKNNLLDYKENYMYSEFIGVEFIDYFINSRKIFQSKLQDLNWSISNKITPLDIGTRFTLFNLKNDKEGFKSSKFKELNLKYFDKDQPKFNSTLFEKNFETSSFISSLIYELILNKNIPLLKNEIEKIIQRFEVSKRIFNNYEKKFSSGYGSCKNIELYLMTSCLLNLYYLRTSSLPSLNCNLKIMDLIISQPSIENIKNDCYEPLFSLIDIERYFVSNLMKKLEIKK